MINFETAVWMVTVKFTYSDDAFSVFLTADLSRELLLIWILQVILVPMAKFHIIFLLG